MTGVALVPIGRLAEVCLALAAAVAVGVVVRAAAGRCRIALSERSSVPLRPRPAEHTVVVVVDSLHRGLLETVAYASCLPADHLLAVAAVTDDEEEEDIYQLWSRLDVDVPLQTFRSLDWAPGSSMVSFLDELRDDDGVVTVLIPRFVAGRWWRRVFHGQSIHLLQARLLSHRGLVVASVPYQLG